MKKVACLTLYLAFISQSVAARTTRNLRKRNFIQVAESDFMKELVDEDAAFWSRELSAFSASMSMSMPATTRADTAPSPCDLDECANPCTEAAIAEEKFYHPHCKNVDKFVQCDEFRGCMVMPCAPGTKCQAELTCIHSGDSGRIQVTTSTPQQITTSAVAATASTTTASTGDASMGQGEDLRTTSTSSSMQAPTDVTTQAPPSSTVETSTPASTTSSSAAENPSENSPVVPRISEPETGVIEEGDGNPTNGDGSEDSSNGVVVAQLNAASTTSSGSIATIGGSTVVCLAVAALSSLF